MTDVLFAELAREVFGPSVDVDRLHAIVKAMPGVSDVHVPGSSSSPAKDDTRKRKALVGGLLFGATAEGAAVARAARSYTDDGYKPKHVALRPTGGSKKVKAAEVGLQAVNFGVGLAAARELVKKPKTSVSKARLVPIPHVAPESLRNANAHARRVGLRLVGATGMAASAGGGYAAGRHTRAPRMAPAPITGEPLAPGKKPPLAKNQVELEYRGEIAKMDSDKRQIFGWANLAKVDGQPVVDLQGDYVPIEEMETSAYSYMLNSRVGGNMHRRIGKFYDTGPVHVADVIESVVFTPEKIQALGLPPDAVPHGWWLGMQINDEPTWQRVKSGELSGLSIHGKGVRRETVL